MLTMLGACSGTTSKSVPINPLDAVEDVVRPKMDAHAHALIDGDVNTMILSGTDLILTLDAILPED